MQELENIKEHYIIETTRARSHAVPSLHVETFHKSRDAISCWRGLEGKFFPMMEEEEDRRGEG